MISKISYTISLIFYEPVSIFKKKMYFHSEDLILRVLRPLSQKQHILTHLFTESILPILPLEILIIISKIAGQTGNFMMMNIAISGKSVFRYIKIGRQNELFNFYMPFFQKRHHIIVPCSFIVLFVSNYLSLHRKVVITDHSEEPSYDPTIFMDRCSHTKSIQVERYIRKPMFKSNLYTSAYDPSTKIDGSLLGISISSDNTSIVYISEIMGKNMKFSPKAQKIIKHLKIYKNYPIDILMVSNDSLYRVLRFPRTDKSNIKEIFKELSMIK